MDFEIRDVDLFAKPEDIALMNPYNEVLILDQRDLLILYEDRTSSASTSTSVSRIRS